MQKISDWLIAMQLIKLKWSYTHDHAPHSHTDTVYVYFSNAAQYNDEQSCLLWGESLMIAFVQKWMILATGPKAIVDLSTLFIELWKGYNAPFTENLRLVFKPIKVGWYAT